MSELSETMKRAECAYDVLAAWAAGDYSSELHDAPLFREAEALLWKAKDEVGHALCLGRAMELACEPLR